MKVILAIILLASIFNSCSGQQAKSNEAKPLRLLEPKMGKEEMASNEDYKHCIDLTHNNFRIVISSKVHVSANTQELISLIENNRKNINKKTISIIYSDQTAPEKVFTILDIFTQQKIKNYKLALADGKFFRGPGAGEGKSSSEEIDISDSSVLVISIQDTCLDISLLKNSEACKQLADVEKFIVRNKDNIDSNKIVVAAEKDLPYRNFEPVISLLKRHEYFNFHISPKN